MFGQIPLPLSHDLLSQLHFHRPHLGVFGLSLLAWRLSSDSSGLRVSPLMLARQASLAGQSSRRSSILSVSAVMGYRSMLSVVFRFQLPEISCSPVIHDLLHSFMVESPCRAVRPPSWDWESVLRYLRSPIFEPLSSSSLRDLTRKTLFLVALAKAKRVGEIQVLLVWSPFLPRVLVFPMFRNF